MDDVFRKSLKDIVGDIITRSRESKKQFWRSTFDFARQNVSIFQTRPSVLNVFCTSLLDSLMDYGCYDHKTVLTVLTVCKRWKVALWRKRFTYNYIIDVLYVIKPLLEDSREDSEDTMLLSAEEDMDIIFEISDVKLTKVLLKEGMLRPFKTDGREYQDFRSLLRLALKTFEIDAIFFMAFLHQWDAPSFSCEISRMINQAILDEFSCQYVEKCETSDYVDRACRRICMIAYVVKTLMMMHSNVSSCEKYVECLLLYYRATPDPFITRDEVKDFLHRYFKPEFWKEAIFEKFCVIYDNLFHPDLSSHYRPRSLKHLCRCNIRNILVQKEVVLSDLESTLPEIAFLKDFLLGGPENAFY